MNAETLKLTFRGEEITADDCRAISELRGLTGLQFERCRFSDDCRGELRNLQNVKHFAISICKNDILEIAPITELPNLKDVRLVGDNVTDATLAKLAASRRLKRCVINSDRITDDGVQLLHELTELQSLSLAGDRLTGKSLETVSNLHAIHTLNLARMSIRDDDLHRLGKLKPFDTLFISEVPISGVGFDQLQQVGLERVFLWDVPITDDGLRSICACPQLNVLSIRSAKITPGGLKHLQNAKSLMSLNLQSTILGDGAVEYLKTLPTTVRVLNLQHVGITRNGLEQLKSNRGDFSISCRELDWNQYVERRLRE